MAHDVRPSSDGRETVREGKHLLIVDDAATIRAYLERLCGEAGYIVSTALNGVEGLEKALIGSPDIIISDLNMPKMDGLSMVRSLRSSPDARQPPVIMLSTEKDTHDFVQAREAGANFFVVKPPKPDLILDLVKIMSGA